MTQLQSENSLLSQFIKSQQLKQKPFPLRSLLILYTKAKPLDVYCYHFAGFKCLVKWLAPIDTSMYKMQEVFLPLYNYEQQEIAVILHVHPSIIQQAFLDIYSNGHQTP